MLKCITGINFSSISTHTWSISIKFRQGICHESAAILSPHLTRSFRSQEWCTIWTVRLPSTRLLFLWLEVETFILIQDLTDNVTRLVNQPSAMTVLTRKKCKECDQTIARNHCATICDCCSLWSHIKCGGVTPKQYLLQFYWIMFRRWNMEWIWCLD